MQPAWTRLITHALRKFNKLSRDSFINGPTFLRPVVGSGQVCNLTRAEIDAPYVELDQLAAEYGKSQQFVEDRASIRETWDMLAENATEFGVLLMRKVAELTGKSSFVSPDEKYFGFTRDYVGTTDAQPAHTWVLLFKQVVQFHDETRAYLRHHVEIPSALTSELDRTIFRNSFKLRAINNDTLVEVMLILVCVSHSHAVAVYSSMHGADGADLSSKQAWIHNHG